MRYIGSTASFSFMLFFTPYKTTWLTTIRSNSRYIACRSCFFSLRHFGHFLLRQIGHWNISVICFTFIFKLAVTVFTSLYFQTFCPKWLIFFGHFENILVYDRKWPIKNSLLHVTAFSCYMRQIAYSRNLNRTFQDMLPCYCYAIKTNNRKISSKFSKPASAGKKRI